MNIKDRRGDVQKIRAIIDSGAQDSLISSTILNNGDWERTPVNINIGGFSTHGVDVKNRVKVCIVSSKNNKEYYLYPLEVEYLQGTVIQPALPGALVNHIKS
ncbi:MAG: hypothetical protein H7835_19605 [Magnetococcus sp. XQGC-1]